MGLLGNTPPPNRAPRREWRQPPGLGNLALEQGMERASQGLAGGGCCGATLGTDWGTLGLDCSRGISPGLWVGAAQLFAQAATTPPSPHVRTPPLLHSHHLRQKSTAPIQFFLRLKWGVVERSSLGPRACPGGGVHTKPTVTMKVCAMPTCTTRRDGVIEPHTWQRHTRGSVGRQVGDNTRRGGAMGPQAHGNTARHVVEGLHAAGRVLD